MPDMLVRLYDLPDCGHDRQRLEANGIRCRRAEVYERSATIQFVARQFPRWVDEAETAFARVPPTMFIAVEGGRVIGFAAYDVTRPDYFGPTGVEPSRQRLGIGRVLLLQCLEALAAEGYAYAIIGGVGPAAFYERTVGAVIIEDSEPGIYRNRVRPTPEAQDA